MNEPVAKTPPPAPGVPGVPAGSPPVAPVAGGNAPVEIPKLAVSDVAKQTVPLFGGLRGGRPRLDGLKPGSPEARDADRRKNSERMAANRERERRAKEPPALPARAAGALDDPGAQTIPVVDGLGLDPVVQWAPEDFRQVAVDCVELAEAWRVDAHTKTAAAGHLPRAVVEEIARDAAFPKGTKNSLSNASPATLAKMFNAMKVPLALKSVIATAPALTFLIIRDFQLTAKIERLVAADKSEKAQPEEKK